LENCFLRKCAENLTMGAQCSSIGNLNNNEHLFQLCGSIPLNANDPAWNQLFSFNLQIPLSRYFLCFFVAVFFFKLILLFVCF
jgi:hypothetical protein